ncbi:hypothetical protein FRC00_011496 [Tulasnella sp. 408]|nr:hypothetical protein FRC00_011496 [Tulasnella sp. 408]
MSKSSTAIEIAATASKILTDICDIPPLSPLKPLINIAGTICEHAAAVNENKEAVIMLAKRVNSTVHILINRARDFKGPMPGNYMDDIKILEG